jgi:hypothetical protein
MPLFQWVMDDRFRSADKVFGFLRSFQHEFDKDILKNYDRSQRYMIGVVNMKGMKMILTLALILAFMGLGHVSGAEKPLEKGDTFPEIKLSIPKNPAHKSYLGLTGDGSFGIKDIKAKAVIVQIFSST